MKQAKSSNMKEKVIFTTALCLSTMTQMMAQNITGKVMNTKGEPLVFANVVLLNRTDSAFVKGAVSGEDGSFVIRPSARIARARMWASSRWKKTAICSVK